MCFTCHTDTHAFRRRCSTSSVPPLFPGALAAKQVGTPYADGGGACMRRPPLRQGQVLRTLRGR